MFAEKMRTRRSGFVSSADDIARIGLKGAHGLRMIFHFTLHVASCSLFHKVRIRSYIGKFT